MSLTALGVANITRARGVLVTLRNTRDFFTEFFLGMNSRQRPWNSVQIEVRLLLALVPLIYMSLVLESGKLLVATDASGKEVPESTAHFD